MDPLPYCGAPAIPADLWIRWNRDPGPIVALAAGAAIHLAWLRWRGAGRSRAAPAVAGWGLAAVVFISPLCALASALFTARSAHHMLLIAVIPPLLLLASRARGPGSGAGRLMGVAILHALTLWAWHAPPAYAAALAHTTVYWAMQGSLFGTALMLWRGVLASETSAAAAGAAMAFTFMQTALLGALLALSRTPFYAFHLGTTSAWGLEPLADQQLAGALMWTLGGVPYLWATLAALGRLLPAAEPAPAS